MESVICVICSERLSNRYSYKRHLEIHMKDNKDRVIAEFDKIRERDYKIFQCSLCSKSFSTKKNLSYHMDNSCDENQKTIVINKIRKLFNKLKSDDDLKRCLIVLNNDRNIFDQFDGLCETKTNGNVFNVTNPQMINSNVSFNQNNNSNSSNINIVVNKYGDENNDHVSLFAEDMAVILDKAKSLGDEHIKRDNRFNMIKKHLQSGKTIERQKRIDYNTEKRKCLEGMNKIDNHILNMIEDILLDFFKMVHLDQEHPENHNIYISNKCVDIKFFVMDDKWVQNGDLKILENKAEILYKNFLVMIDCLIEVTNNEQIKGNYLVAKEKINECYLNNNQNFLKSLAKKYHQLVYQNKHMLRETFEKTKDQQTVVAPKKFRMSISSKRNE